jgi:L-alanine-DL-glutamate epimerase-like enolase superfamily enzyme
VATFRLSADVSSENLEGVGQVLRNLVNGEVTRTPDGWHVAGVMDGEDARDVNRRLLSAMRRVERRTRWRAEWAGGGSVYRFFDYALKSQRGSAE